MYYRAQKSGRSIHRAQNYDNNARVLYRMYKDLQCSDNMERYRDSVPAFRYNTAVFPPYGDTIHHWYISTLGPDKHVSLITDSKEDICNYINNRCEMFLCFVPLPDTLQ